MKKSVKRTISLLVTVAVIISGVYYFVETHHAMGRWMYSSPQAAIGEDSAAMLFEYQDDDFYVGFSQDGKRYSAKKNVAFWVENDFNFFESCQHSNLCSLRNRRRSGSGCGYVRSALHACKDLLNDQLEIGRIHIHGSFTLSQKFPYRKRQGRYPRFRFRR